MEKSKSTPRVLIIEDDEAFAQWISDCLPGSERFIVSDCEAAKQHMRANRFDVVILDLSLAKGQSRDWMRIHAPKSALVCITGSIEHLPEDFDAAEHKINLNSRHLVENLIYGAIRKRAQVTSLLRDVEAVETCARLIRRHA